MFRLHRVFCATPWEMEAGRNRFYALVGQFHEDHAMARGILIVPVSLVNIRDKRPLQYVIDENIQDSTGYFLLLQDGWGPVEPGIPPSQAEFATMEVNSTAACRRN